MCVNCVAQASPYVLGSLGALKVMGLSARRSRLVREVSAGSVAARPGDQVAGPPTVTAR